MTVLVASVLCAVALAGPAAAGSAPLVPVLQGGKWGYMDRAGRVAVSPRFDEASRFSEGLAAVRLGNLLIGWHLNRPWQRQQSLKGRQYTCWCWGRAR